MSEWRYYNRALIPMAPPHETPDISSLNDISEFTKKGGRTPLFARWTSDFGKTTHEDWYYIIKSTPFDITALKTNRRHKINKGKRNFQCRKIDASKHVEEIYNIFRESYETYPKKTRPYIDLETATRWTRGWKDVWGAFDNNGKLCGFIQSNIRGRCIELTTIKSLPSRERENVNFAIIAAFLEDNAQALTEGKYICNGERNLVHETNFNDFLERYFAFERIYCKLNIRYFGFVKVVARVLYPIRKLFYKSKNKLFFSIGSVLRMEEIARKTGGEY